MKLVMVLILVVWLLLPVLWKQADHAFLKELGVDDSKNLTDVKIKQIAPLLEAKLPHKALLLSPQKYNEVVGDNKLHNAVSVKVALHNQRYFPFAPRRMAT